MSSREWTRAQIFIGLWWTGGGVLWPMISREHPYAAQDQPIIDALPVKSLLHNSFSQGLRAQMYLHPSIIHPADPVISVCKFNSITLRSVLIQGIRGPFLSPLTWASAICLMPGFGGLTALWKIEMRQLSFFYICVGSYKNVYLD